MWPFGKSRTGSFETALIVDVGSASIGGALVVRMQGKLPRVIYHTRRSIPFHAPLNPERLMRDALAATRHVVEDLNNKGRARLNPNVHGKRYVVGTALIGYTSPWFNTDVKTHTALYEKPRIIVRGDIDALVRSGDARSIRSRDETVIERALTALTLDGYIVHKPNDTQIRELSVTTVTSTVPENIKHALEDTLLATAHPKRIIHHSFPLMATSVIRNIFPHLSSFLYLDITGEVTDVTHVERGVITSVGSFPIGVHTILRRVSENFGASIDRIDSLLAARKDKILHEPDSSKFDLILDQERSNWRKALQNTLEHMRIRGLSEQIIYTVDQESLHFFGIIYDEGENPTQQKATHLYGAFLKDYIYFPEGAITDPFLALEAIFLQSYS